MIKGLFEIRDGDPIEEFTPIPHTPWSIDFPRNRIVMTDDTSSVVHAATSVFESFFGQQVDTFTLVRLGRRLQALWAGVPWEQFSATLEVMES